jgi:hypothetical protein
MIASRGIVEIADDIGRKHHNWQRSGLLAQASAEAQFANCCPLLLNIDFAAVCEEMTQTAVLFSM